MTNRLLFITALLGVGALSFAQTPSHEHYVLYPEGGANDDFATKYRSWQPGQPFDSNFADDEEFFISRVKLKDRFTYAQTQVDPEQDPARRFLWWVPMGQSQWNAVPAYFYNSDRGYPGAFVREEPERVRMYYALQKIKADDKCYVTHTTDSVIRAVVRYYTDAGDPDLLMEAYYYLGSVYRDMGDAPRAVEAFQKAVGVGQESGSERYDLLGRSYEQIGYRLAYQGLYNEALEAYKKSYNYNADRPKGKIYALRNIARMYNAINEVDSAICYYMRHTKGCG